MGTVAIIAVICISLLVVLPPSAIVIVIVVIVVIIVIIVIIVVIAAIVIVIVLIVFFPLWHHRVSTMPSISAHLFTFYQSMYDVPDRACPVYFKPWLYTIFVKYMGTWEFNHLLTPLKLVFAYSTIDLPLYNL